MSDIFNTPTGNTNNEDAVALAKQELEALRKKAKVMGISFSGNTGADKLRAAILEKEEGGKVTSADGDEGAEANQKEEPKKRERLHDARNRLRKEALKLVRVRIQNLNPAQKNRPGEWITVANSMIGTVKRYVPFDEAGAEAYHVEACILKVLEKRVYARKNVKQLPSGHMDIATKMVREFAIEKLPPLTKEEIKALAADQTASGRLEEA